MSPPPPETSALRGGGQILVGGAPQGAGVAVSPRLVLTAAHVLGGQQPSAPVAFRTQDGRVVTVTAAIRFGDGQDAAALQLDADVPWSPAAPAEARTVWSAGSTGVSNDSALTGDVTTILPLVTADGQRVTVMQLRVDQILGDYQGYSGSGIFNDQGQVTGLLIEQKLQRLNIRVPEASNVLYALPVSDVVTGLGLPLALAPARTYLRDGFASLIEHYTVFFAQRPQATALLREFMAGAEGGYLAVVAPADFGKTALVADLVRQGAPRLAYHFFSQWYSGDGLDEDFFLKDVLEQLLPLYGRVGRPGDDIHGLRATYHDLLGQAPDEPLTVVLDGIDAVTGWNLAPYLSRTLPANVHVIVTIRDMGQDWAAEYGLPASQTSCLRLEGLGRGELGDALRQAGPAGADLADGEALFGDLVQAAAYADDTDLGADPLYVRFLLEDLADGRLTPGTLTRLPRGLTSYLDTWWEQLRDLAGPGPSRDFFGTLVAALGPVGRNDLTQLNESLRAASSWDPDPLDVVLRSARRLVFGNDREGYALAGPRLHAYVRAKVGANDQYRAKVLAYCADWQANKSAYALAYYPRHLLESGSTGTLYGLIGKAWIEARAQQSSYQAPAADARQVSDAARSADPPDLVPEIRHSLIYATLGSFTSSLRPAAIYLLAQLGAAKEARAFASMIQDEQDRIEAHIAVGTGLLARGETDTARAELRRAMRDAGTAHLAALAPAMAQLGDFNEVRTALGQIADPDLRSRTVAKCATALAADGWLAEALGVVGLLEPPLPRVRILGDMAKAFADATQPDAALESAEAALSLARETTDGTETGALALALAARALVRANATDRAGQTATLALASLAGLTPDWRQLETVCVAAQALAPSGSIEEAVRSAVRIAEAERADVDLPALPRPAPGSAKPSLGSGATDVERAMNVQREVEQAAATVIAMQPTRSNLVSMVPEKGLVIVAGYVSADDAKANAINWLAQSLADESPPAVGPMIADSLLAALAGFGREPTPMRALAASYVALIAARARDTGRAIAIAEDVFAALRAASPQKDLYEWLLHAIAPALMLTGQEQWQWAMNAIGSLEAPSDDAAQYDKARTDVLREVARQFMLDAEFASALGITHATDDPQVKSDIFAQVLETVLRVAPDDVFGYFLAITQLDHPLVSSLPPRQAAPVLTSAAGIMMAIGSYDWVPDLLEQVVDAGVAVPEDFAISLNVAIAAALADIGDVVRARRVLSDAVLVNGGAAAAADGRAEPPADTAATRDPIRDFDTADQILAAQALDRIGDFDAAEQCLMAMPEESKNRCYGLTDHAVVLARAGQGERAAAAARLITMPLIRAGALSQVAAILAAADDTDRAEGLAEEALRVLAQPGTVAAPSKVSVFIATSDHELIEGSVLLSGAVRALPAASGRSPSTAVISALITAGTAESGWIRDLGLDQALRQILVGDRESAVAELGRLKAKAAAGPPGFQRARALRWVAELLLHLGETAAAAAIAEDIASWPVDATHSFGPNGEAWQADILRRLAEALFRVGETAAAAAAAGDAMTAARAVSDDAGRRRAVERVIATYATVGRADDARAQWHQELAAARDVSRGRLFDTLRAGTGALARYDQGDTLWAVYQAVRDVEAWWGTLRL